MSLAVIRFRAFVMGLWEYLPKIRQLRAQVKAQVGADSVLEIGCGFGRNAALFSGKYKGIDIDASAVQIASLAHPDQNFAVMDVTDGSLKKGEYETVLFCLCLHEMENRKPVLAAIAKTGATRILVFDFDPGMNRWSRFRLALMEEPTIKTYWDFDLERQMTKLGWEPVSLQSINPLFRMWEFKR